MKQQLAQKNQQKNPSRDPNREPMTLSSLWQLWIDNLKSWRVYREEHADLFTLNLQAGDFVGLPTAEASWGFKTFTMDEYNQLIEDIRSGKLVVSDEIAEHPAVAENVTVNYID